MELERREALYEAVLKPEQLTSPDQALLPAAAVPQVVEILGSRHLRIGAEEVALETPHEIFALNGLLLAARGRACTSADIQALGYEYDKDILVRALRTVVQKLNQAAGWEVADLQQGTTRRPSMYRLFDALDIRWNPQEDYEQLPMPVPKKRAPLNGYRKAAARREAGEESGLNPREDAILAVSHRYATDTRIARRMAEARPSKRTAAGASASGHMDARLATKWLAGQYDHELTYADEKKLMLALERGIDAFRASDGKQPTAEQEAAMLDLTFAYQYMHARSMRAAFHYAKYYAARSEMRVEDLFYAAIEKLPQAICQFDMSGGRSFDSYAIEWMAKHGIRRAIANEARMVRLPAHQHELTLKLGREYERLSVGHMDEPTYAELAEAAGIEEEEVALLIRANGWSTIHSRPSQSDGENSSVEATMAHPQNHYQELLDRLSDQQMLDRLMTYRLKDERPKTLNQMRIIFCLRYDVMLPNIAQATWTVEGKEVSAADMQRLAHQRYGEGGLSLAEVSELMGVSLPWVSDCHRRAIKKLQGKKAGSA